MSVGLPLLRHQLPVASPLRPRTLARGAWVALRDGAVARAAQRAADAQLRFASGAHRAVLIDGGTTALVLALRLVRDRGPVAFPAYGCIDLAAAAAKAGVRVRLYDVDPRTLGPDMASLEAVLRAGAGAVVLAHLYGYPADAPAVAKLAHRHGAVLVEDAAQAAGGVLHGRPLGSFGDLVVRSFGRGKGTCAGRGGALLGFAPEFDEALGVAADALPAARAGAGVVLAAAAQWLLGRPALYGVPASIPGLRLGEMVHHPAGEPARITNAAAAMLGDALAADADAARARTELAVAWDAALPDGIPRAHVLAGARPGYLRYPVLVPADVPPAPRLGALRAYPCTLADMAPIRPLLLGPATPLRGAERLARELMTLPTHRFVTRGDVRRTAAWLARAVARAAVRAPAGALPDAARRGAGAVRP